MNLSVVIPVYNGAKTIVNAVKSVVEQKKPADDFNIEIIVVNDGSVDNTLQVLNEYVRTHQVQNISIYTTANGGVSHARNYGINKSRYDWIGFLDADDIWCNNKLEIQYKYLTESCVEPVFIGSARNEEVLSLCGQKITSLYKARLIDLLIKVFPQTSTALVRKDMIMNCGLYDTNMTHSEDADLWVRICARGGNFYYHPESTVSTGSGKHNFGDSGLSANLKLMEKGACYMLHKTRKRGDISFSVYVLLYIFFKIKYLRRLIIVKFRG
ncbi:MAG: glycosyltransferase family A protein [Leclercia adecarboxylata]|nr:glycosyltransferase family A protein [Leclercia adecarboxylata]